MQIFEFLQPKSLGKLAQTSNYCRLLCESDWLWKQITANQWRDALGQQDLTYKSVYVEREVLYYPLGQLLLGNDMVLLKTLFHVLNTSFSERRELMDALALLFEANRKMPLILQNCIKEDLSASQNSEEDEVSLFSSNSLGGNLFYSYSKIVCRAYLQTAIGPIVRDVCEDDSHTELDSRYLAAGENREDNAKYVKEILQALFDNLRTHIQLCPMQIRALVSQVTCLCRTSQGIEEQQQDEGEEEVERKDEYKYSVEANLFLLKFILPTIIKPEDYGLCTKAPSLRTRRKLIVIAKCVANIANEQPFLDVEPDFKIMDSFITSGPAVTAKRLFLKELGAVNTLSDTYASPLDFTDFVKSLHTIVKYIKTSLPDIQSTLHYAWCGDVQELPSDSIEVYEKLSAEMQMLETVLNQKFPDGTQNTVVNPRCGRSCGYFASMLVCGIQS
mmetsp:Transcript_16434/g.18261  ORF Transcript_16434/g.18261 Transcript_16434/m.18261 type:complete len:445 (+) Transcript_16434:248-1582(+)